ncbi:hypothetical protein GCM10011579_000400 [Streptomyces albiflavescens]|uniref:Uncharacterized protein n=1 Tax=Streptomyces albiflavescens TaxID=1623582 RepID=A0A917XRF3_9ACTN|nr:hypothetical protein [Streptomyces albiflavescens]GGN48090.1 hypothetical protein GCM10011579_000400 [Streptomyces albiflavescens]
MVSVTHAAHNIEITAEGLQEELARLELQKEALERELAAVMAHLGSVRRTLSAFESLMRAPTAAASTGPTGSAAAERGQAAAPAAPQTSVASPGATDTTTPSAAPKARKPEKGKTAERPVSTDTDADGQKQYGKLTEQIMEYFAKVGDVDVRAREVAAALGRDSDSGSINAVRSTLDRLVGTSRVRRTGRGLYRAKRS